MERSVELEALTRRIAGLFTSGDIDAMRAACDFGPEARWIGTDAEEWWDGPTALQLVAIQREEASEDELEIREVEAWEEGTAGWAVAKYVYVLADRTVPARLTAVYRLDGAQWKLIHVHNSLGISNLDAFGRELTTSLDLVAQAVEVERPDLGSVTAPDGTVTLLFTDIEGSTERNSVLGDREWMLLLQEHHDLVRDQVAANAGFEVKSMGDGFMIAFSSARRAMQCAMDIQRSVEKDPDLDIRIRAGLHAGEAVRLGDDFYGGVVNMAARVAGSAAGGEVLVSTLVKALVDASGEFSFGVPRSVELKGIAGMHEVHPVLL